MKMENQRYPCASSIRAALRRAMRDDLIRHHVPHLHFPLSILHLRNSGGIELSALYLVATPIGNLSDLSLRAREVLSTVDFIAAEDTRVTQKLLNACELPKKPMISYYEHNRRARGEAVLEKLLAGETCALVTDAGTPAVSDPGEDLSHCAPSTMYPLSRFRAAVRRSVRWRHPVCRPDAGALKASCRSTKRPAESIWTHCRAKNAR